MKKITQEQFDETILLMCSRWSDEVKEMARLMVLEGKTPTAVAALYSTKRQRTSFVRSEFFKKFNIAGARVFMDQEAPTALPAQLALHEQAIKKLLDSGYSIIQVCNYLEENGITATEEVISNYFGSDGL